MNESILVEGIVLLAAKGAMDRRKSTLGRRLSNYKKVLSDKAVMSYFARSSAIERNMLLATVSLLILAGFRADDIIASIKKEALK